MAKRELSSTLKNLKFMKRAAQSEKITHEEEETKPDGNFSSSATVNTKCLVMMDGGPQPGTIKGRMSFLSFNPSIDKLNEDAAAFTSSSDRSGPVSDRENLENLKKAKINGEDLKRKPDEVMLDEQNPNKLQKKKGKKKLEWSVLRPSNSPSMHAG